MVPAQAPAGQKHRWLQHDHLMLVEGTVRKPAAVASPAPDDDARPFAANPSIAAPRRSQRTADQTSPRCADLLKLKAVALKFPNVRVSHPATCAIPPCC